MPPCDSISTVEIDAGTGIEVTNLGGVYTIGLSAEFASLIGNFAIYATEAARDLDNPNPDDGDLAWVVADTRLWQYDGLTWFVVHEPRQSFTPTSANITVGAGTLTGWFTRQAGECSFESVFTFGAGSAMGTNPSLGLPKLCTNIRMNQLQVGIDDSSGGAYPGTHSAVASGGSSVPVFAVSSSGANAAANSITSTVPMTWASGDVLSLAGRYNMLTHDL